MLHEYLNNTSSLSNIFNVGIFRAFFTFIDWLDLPVNKSATIIHAWSVLLEFVEYKPFKIFSFLQLFLDVTTSRVYLLATIRDNYLP